MAAERKQRAIVLFSGGIDSATTLALASREDYIIHALSFDYGQRHGIEVAAAKKLARTLGASEHRIITIDLRSFGGSALTGAITVPKNRTPDEMERTIPVTYVPARNTIFLSYAVAWAEVIGARDIFIGVNAIDYSGYPDCRPEFIAQFERLANVATQAGTSGDSFRIHAPLIEMTKAQIIRKGTELSVDFSLTHSCYDPAANGGACGECDSCLLRAKGFKEAGIEDPTRYATLSA
jgi:7-cyano-7-deazaguanine synthase